MKVLIIDDEFEARKGVEAMLAHADCSILTASDAVSALLLLKDDEEIKAVITDYRLKGFGGKEWIDVIRHYHPEKKLVVITGYSNLAGVIKNVKVLIKPFTPEQLLEALEL